MKITSQKESITIEYTENLSENSKTNFPSSSSTDIQPKNDIHYYNFDNFIIPKNSDINLKFTFDHIQNYGLSAGICVIGMLLFNNTIFVSPLFENNHLRYTISLTLILTGFIFCTLNTIQGMSVILKTQKKNYAYYIYSFSLFAIGITFFGGMISVGYRTVFP